MAKGWIRKSRNKLNNLSKAEIIVAQILRESLIAYERNFPVHLPDGRVRFLDFYLQMNDIAIEIDGREHNLRDDEIREREIAQVLPVKFIRFSNGQVYHNRNFVKARICEHTPNRLLYEERKLTRSERKQMLKDKKRFVYLSREAETWDTHLREIARFG
jgi:very-short-patch-repair endonuclease